ncbi:MAG: hypothetical protein K5838_08965 [Elusimicrobiales bacterium]|nr:hypothetical protein [Elusimicrobiales bacterium]
MWVQNEPDLKYTNKQRNIETSFAVGSVNPKLFHDIFEINRKYLPNGNLVDLHDDYSNCKCFITSDGLAGFAIEPDGNLVSVFSLNPTDKKGFLYAIRDFIKKHGANKLDCFISQAQPLQGIYKKTLGFKTASILDFNYEVLAESKGKEYADNFVKTHGEAQVAFMVLSDNEVPERHFSKDEYDQAKEYQISQAENNNNGQTLYQSAKNSLPETIEIEENGNKDLTSYDVKVTNKKAVAGNISTDKSLALRNGTDYIVAELIKFVKTDLEKYLRKALTA